MSFIYQTNILRNDTYTLLPIQQEIIDHKQDIIADLLNLFSNEAVIKYNPNYTIKSTKDAEYLFDSIIEATINRISFIYLLFETESNLLIGKIDLITPRTVRRNYPMMYLMCQENTRIDIEEIWAIEYYLNAKYWNNKIMSNFLSPLIEDLLDQGCEAICALSHNNNIASKKTLEKIEFINYPEYSDLQNQGLYIKYKKKKL